jgi:hypothetical protein
MSRATSTPDSHESPDESQGTEEEVDTHAKAKPPEESAGQDHFEVWSESDVGEARQDQSRPHGDGRRQRHRSVRFEGLQGPSDLRCTPMADAPANTTAHPRIPISRATNQMPRTSAAITMAKTASAIP